MTVHEERLGLQAAALEAAERGWRVFPLRPGGTAPAIRDWQARASTDRSRIERCWREGSFNVGIALCVSGLAVLELTAAEPGELPSLPYRLPGVVDGADVLALRAEREGASFPTETFAVRAPSGGLMLYFEHPDGACPPCLPGPDGPLGWHVALRAADAYVPAAGSVTELGFHRLVHGAQPAPLPEWMALPLKVAESSPTNHSTPLKTCPFAPLNV
ncbi:bifunctional DNA primase/polymerase [Streptomyces sp. NPDC001889]